MRARHAGFTLIEMMVTVTVATLLTVMAVPNMQEMVQRRQLEGAAGEVYNNLLLMRSEAISKNRAVFVNFTGSGTGWSYGLDDSAACNPVFAGSCQVNQTDRVYRGTTWKTVTLAQPFTGSAISFDPRRGVPSSSGTIQLTSDAGQINVTVSPIGYISACSPDRLGGYSAC